MNVVFECGYSKLAIEHLIESNQEGIIYGIASTWLELSRVLCNILNVRNKNTVVLFVSDELLFCCDFFSKLSNHDFICQRINKLLDINSPDVDHIKKTIPFPIFTPKELVYINLLNKGLTTKEISLELKTNIKNVYNQKAALIGRIGLPNEHILYLLSPFILKIINCDFVDPQ